MAKKKEEYIYVMVLKTDNKRRFVTEVDNSNRTCRWDANKDPYRFQSREWAKDLCLGLCWNGTLAVVVESLVPLTERENSEEV